MVMQDLRRSSPVCPKGSAEGMGIRWDDEGAKGPGQSKRGWHASAGKPCPSETGLKMPVRRMAAVAGGWLVGGNNDLWFSSCIAGCWNGVGG